MRGVTLYLNDMLEEREREERRRRRGAFAAAIAIALLGLAAAALKPKPPPPIVKIREVFVPVEVECAVEVEKEKRIVVTVPAPSPPPVELLTLRAKQQIDLTDPSAPRTRHLCVTPKRLGLGEDAASDRVTISNVGETPMRITKIEALPKRSAFFVNAAGCAGRTLQPRERCTIGIGLLDGDDETMGLRIANDAGEDETIFVTAASAARATPAPAS